MPDVVGYDLGLAHAGAASVTDRGTRQTWHLQTDPTDGLGPTAERIVTVSRWCLSFITTGTVLAMIEAPSFGSQHGLQHERAAVYWRVVTGLHNRGIPTAVAAPSTIKKWLTGRGDASKNDMRRALAALHPGLGLARVTEHEIDALAAADVGVQCWAGWPGPWLSPSPTALATITWPDHPEQQP